MVWLIIQDFRKDTLKAFAKILDRGTRLSGRFILRMRYRLVNELRSNLQPLPLRQMFSGDGRAGLDKFLFRRSERAAKIALDIELRCKLALHEDGDNNFALHHGRPHEITRILGDV